MNYFNIFKFFEEKNYIFVKDVWELAKKKSHIKLSVWLIKSNIDELGDNN